MAFFNAGNPAEGVYFVCPSFIDSTAAAIICWGVLKSGSPAPKPMTSSPCSFNSFALAVIAKVDDGVNDFTLFASSTAILIPPIPSTIDFQFFSAIHLIQSEHNNNLLNYFSKGNKFPKMEYFFPSLNGQK